MSLSFCTDSTLFTFTVMLMLLSTVFKCSSDCSSVCLLPGPLRISHPSALLDVRSVSHPGDGFSYLELASRLADESNLPEKDDVVLLEEVRFVDDSEPGFRGAAGHWERSGQTVLGFAHYGFRKGTVKVRGAYRPASKVGTWRLVLVLIALL